MSNEEKNRVIAKLGYHKFTIKSHKTSEHIQQVSRDINQLLADISKKFARFVSKIFNILDYSDDEIFKFIDRFNDVIRKQRT